MDEHRLNFDEEITFLLNACPGPAVMKQGLHIVAFQEVPGIPRLAPARQHDQRPTVSVSGVKAGPVEESGREYVCSVNRVAELVNCRAGYLSEAALRHGFQYSRALRWIRFLHGMALYGVGASGLTVAMRLGFSDLAGWSRFSQRLVRRTPSQLPNLPFDFWVRKAVDDLFLSSAKPDTDSPERNRAEDNLER